MSLDDAEKFYREAYERYADCHNPMVGRDAHRFALKVVLTLIEKEAEKIEG